ncbi:MAG: class A beta-lactamase [Parvibaculum sp.]|uniref:class A beta-lactamase n=1 Tax=Parvibaculum sp. TaxID=2024848 RepID=UPI003C77DBC0
MPISRREILLGSVALLAISPTFAGAKPAIADAERELVALETRHNGRLGVAILDTASGRRLGHRGDERFGMCSTFKFLAAAAVLDRVDRGLDSLDRRISFSKSDLLEYAPVAAQHVGEGGMTLGALCAAAVELSDNTAGNLILNTLGGPAGLTRYARSLGDEVTRLDRTEPTLNIIEPGDPRDTTTPNAMLALMNSTLLGNALSPSSRTQLQHWMLSTKTGAGRIRAGLPSDWRIGHKTGSGAKAETNDVGVIWPTGRAPVLVAAYYEGGGEPPDARDAVLADIGRLIVKSL